MRFLVCGFLKTDKGEWLQPGTIVDLEPDQAALWKSQGMIKAYRTQMVSPQETRVVDMPLKNRRRRNA